MSAAGEQSGRESAERRLTVIYGELRALVQPTGTLNDAPLARREELEREAAALRERWHLTDPRDRAPGARELRVKPAIIFFSVLGVIFATATVLGFISGTDSRLPGVPLWAFTLVGFVCAIGGVLLILRQAANRGGR